MKDQTFSHKCENEMCASERECVRRRLARLDRIPSVNECLLDSTRVHTSHAVLSNDGRSCSALQLCFINPAAEMIEAYSDEQTNVNFEETQQNEKWPLLPTEDDAYQDKKQLHNEATEADLLQQHNQLQQVACRNLAKAHLKAHTEISLDRERKSSAGCEEIVQAKGVLGAEELVRRRHYSSTQLQRLNAAQLQVLLNDLHVQVQGQNEQLVQLLMQRDVLSSAQDSLLVDAQDLQIQAQEAISSGAQLTRAEAQTENIIKC